MDTAPRDIIRNVAFEVTRSEEDGDGLTLEGYAAVFDSPTEINSWEGRFIETVERGAFSKSISEKTPVLMFNHGQHPMIGDMPIGAITHLREDNRGLFVRARLATNWLIEPVREAIKQGSISGMSFRMRVIKDAWQKPAAGGDMQRRAIQEVSCPELGPVVFPAYLDTEVGVRSREIVNALEDDNLRAELAWALLSDRADKAPYGDVNYADPGYKDDKQKRYPINTEAHAKAAWAYINIEKNQQGYTPAQVTSVKGRIKAALKKFGVAVSEDANKSADAEGNDRDNAGWTVGDLAPVLEDAIEDQLYEDQPVMLSDFTDTTAYYCVWEQGEMELYEIEYTIDDAGKVTLGEPTEVLKKTTYVPATSDEAAEDGTSEGAGRSTSEPPRHSPPESVDAVADRFKRLLKARELGVI
jgi:HK97 family phage prohead protease